MPIFLAGLLAVFAAGCSSSDQTQAPAEIAPAQTSKQSASIALVPVAAPGSVSDKMGQMLASAAKQKNIPIKEDGESDYKVRGYLVASPESEGTKVSYIWDVTDSSGKRAHRFSGEEMVDKRVSGDPWSAVDEKAMRKIALNTADRLHEWLPKKDIPAAQVATTGSVNATSVEATDEERASLAAASDTSSEVVVVVPEATGAPGDGNTALPAAMRRQLETRGIKLTDSRSSNSYTVRGTVELGEVEDGKQPITIRWLVLGPDGEPLKSAVVQRNKIAEGSLDGDWGRVADLAAGEAAKAVTKILPEPTS
ncbi:MAG: hypothetical protein ACLFU3_04550 [Dichotomicrobium sp.]